MHHIALWSKFDSIFIRVRIDFQKKYRLHLKPNSRLPWMRVWRDKTKPYSQSVSDRQTQTHTHTHKKKNTHTHTRSERERKRSKMLSRALYPHTDGTRLHFTSLSNRFRMIKLYQLPGKVRKRYNFTSVPSNLSICCNECKTGFEFVMGINLRIPF